MKRKPRKRRGQKPKLRDKRTRAKFLKEISGGLSIAQACLLIDCHPETYRNECRRDAEFAAQVKQARAQFVATIIGHCVRHAKDDPRTALHLAACFDKRFRKAEPKNSTNTYVSVTIEQQRIAIAAAAAELGISDVFEEDTEPGTTTISGQAVSGGDGLPPAARTEKAPANTDPSPGGLSEPDLP